MKHRLLRLEQLPRGLDNVVNAWPVAVGGASARILRVGQDGILVDDEREPVFVEGAPREVVMLYFVVRPRFARSVEISSEMGRYLGTARIDALDYEVFESAAQELRFQRPGAPRTRAARASTRRPASE